MLNQIVRPYALAVILGFGGFMLGYLVGIKTAQVNRMLTQLYYEGYKLGWDDAIKHGMHNKQG